MPTYVTLLKNTAEGAKDIKNFGDAVKEAASWIERDGGKVVAAYALQGNYDFLWVTEYKDEKGIWKSLLSAAQRGLVTTETTLALHIEEFLSLLDKGEPASGGSDPEGETSRDRMKARNRNKPRRS